MKAMHIIEVIWIDLASIVYLRGVLGIIEMPSRILLIIARHFTGVGRYDIDPRTGRVSKENQVKKPA